MLLIKIDDKEYTKKDAVARKILNICINTMKKEKLKYLAYYYTMSMMAIYAKLLMMNIIGED